MPGVMWIGLSLRYWQYFRRAKHGGGGEPRSVATKQLKPLVFAVSRHLWRSAAKTLFHASEIPPATHTRTVYNDV